MAKNTKQDPEKESHKIHLVGGDGEASPKPADALPVSNRIEIGEYIADILVDRRSFPLVVHWIVQRRGSPDILQWGHEDTYEAAQREAVAWIESLLRYDEYRKTLDR